MPEYKLTYFNMRGRAEFTRMCFAYKGIPYEDERIEMANWPQRKAGMPGGQVPVLWIDGSPLTESIAITRYIAKQAGLVPQDDVQAAHCDAIVDTLNDVTTQLYHKYRFSKAEPAEKEKTLKEHVENKFNPVLNRLNERLSNQKTFISEMTTWADLLICLATEEFKINVPDVLKNYPAVSAHVERIKALKSMKEYYSKRPVTDW